jgi:uncharacterized membrane protein
MSQPQIDIEEHSQPRYRSSSIYLIPLLIMDSILLVHLVFSIAFSNNPFSIVFNSVLVVLAIASAVVIIENKGQSRNSAIWIFTSISVVSLSLVVLNRLRNDKVSLAMSIVTLVLSVIEIWLALRWSPRE